MNMTISERANQEVEGLKVALGECSTAEDTLATLLGMIEGAYERLMQEDICIGVPYMCELIEYLKGRADEHNSTEQEDLIYLAQIYTGFSSLIQSLPELRSNL